MRQTCRFLCILAFAFCFGASSATAQDSRKEEAERVSRAKRYMEAGMPSPDRMWSAIDYEQALEVFTKISKDRSLPLPILHDDPSGGIFARLINPENLELARSEKLSIQERLGEAGSTTKSISLLMRIYLDNQTTGLYRNGDEQLELFAFALVVYDVLISNAESFLKTLTEAEKADPVRKKGLDQMKMGMATTIKSILLVLQETDHYKIESLIAYAEKLPELLPPIWGFMEPLTQVEFRRSFRLLSRKHSEEKIRQALEKLLKALPPDPDAEKKAESKTQR